MDMFTSYGHIKKPKITDFLMILAWASPFNEITLFLKYYYKLAVILDTILKKWPSNWKVRLTSTLKICGGLPIIYNGHFHEELIHSDIFLVIQVMKIST